MKRNRKQLKPLEIIVSAPITEVLESEAIIMRFDAPLFGTVVILSDMNCGECHRAGILVVSVKCASCKVAQVNRIMCLRSNVRVARGTIEILDAVITCDDCNTREDDTAPPIVGGPLRSFDPTRLN